MSNPLVSVVMSVYNSEKYLKEAIDSILNQTYTNFEFIIINDGSTDSSLDIIQKYMKKDGRIVLISRENKGLPYSLNEGIGKAKGKYIARMDADDISLPTRFEEQVKFMESNEEVGVCGTYVEFFGLRNNKTWKTPITDEECKITLMIGSCFAHPSVFIRKIILTNNKLCYDNDMYTAQDYALWSALATHTSFANIPKTLLKYREVEGSISNKAKTNLDNKFNLISKYIGRNLDLFRLNNSKNIKILFSLLVNKSYSKVECAGIIELIVKMIKKNQQLDLYDSFLLKRIILKKLIIYNIKIKNYKCLFNSLKVLI